MVVGSKWEGSVCFVQTRSAHPFPYFSTLPLSRTGIRVKVRHSPIKGQKESYGKIVLVTISVTAIGDRKSVV